MRWATKIYWQRWQARFGFRTFSSSDEVGILVSFHGGPGALYGLSATMAHVWQVLRDA